MPKILYIEDDLDLQKVVARRLEKEGYDVICADNGLEGLELVSKGRPDLIILDLQFPEGDDGLGTLRSFRLFRSATFTPIIILTGNQDEGFKEKVINEDVEAYLEKPYDPEALIAAIRHALEE